MKFQIDRKRLIEAATIAAKSAGQRTVRPILANVLINAKSEAFLIGCVDTCVYSKGGGAFVELSEIALEKAIDVLKKVLTFLNKLFIINM